MLIYADFHTHSTASDGQFSPTDLVKLARKVGIQLLSLTDHDTLAGLDEAAEAAQEEGIKFLRGAEFAAKEHKKLHILAYNIPRGPSPLSDFCQQLQEDRKQRNTRIFQYLASKKLYLSPHEVNGYSRPNFARALLNRNYVLSIQEAFDKYLDTPEFSNIERQKPSVAQILEIVKNSHSFAALAHPAQLELDDKSLENLLKYLKNHGLTALECHHSSHTPAQSKFYQSLAQKYQLFPTSGSDYHGPQIKPSVHLTPWPVEIDGLQAPGILL